MLQVKVNNMKYQVGRVEYDVPETFSFPMEAIAGIAAGGGFLLLIIILILIIYRRQSTRAERIYHKLQIQLDNLESNVRNECKQGRGWGGGWWTVQVDFVVFQAVVVRLQVYVPVKLSDSDWLAQVTFESLRLWLLSTGDCVNLLGCRFFRLQFLSTSDHVNPLGCGWLVTGDWLWLVGYR